jgi:hypothetical protein
MRPLPPSWKAKPGNFDPMHAGVPLPSSNIWGIPDLAQITEAPGWMVPFDDWRAAINKHKLPTGDGPGGVHFFVEDYRFECCWNNPERAANQLNLAKFVLSPDFSLFRDHSPIIQLWNTYRSRWLGAYWANLGMQVIPTVGWSTADSYEFCFLGLPMDSVLAVATFTGRDQESKELFLMGYREMVLRLEPRLVMCYGERLPPEVADIAPTRMYEPWQMGLRKLDAKKSSSVTG